MSKLPNQESPDVTWRDGGLPVSSRFDDTYFAHPDGRAETAEVFVRGNGLPDRWRHNEGLHIAELGFGTGLNVFETLRTWNEVRRDNACLRKLQFTSFERFPMAADDMARGIERWPELLTLAAPILDAWRVRDPNAGEFCASGESWRLSVRFGDATTRLCEWTGRADAWFLDGFSPAKNPEMWNERLMQLVAEKTAPGGTFSTYTAAGYVRRGLLAAGFDVQKVPGHGSKRERLQGQLKPSPSQSQSDQS